MTAILDSLSFMYSLANLDTAMKGNNQTTNKESESKIKADTIANPKPSDRTETEATANLESDNESETDFATVLEIAKENDNHIVAPLIYNAMYKNKSNGMPFCLDINETDKNNLIGRFQAESAIMSGSGYSMSARSRIRQLQSMTMSDINISCTISMPQEKRYADNSEECFAQRKKIKSNKPISTVCYFDWKAFMPESSRIKTDYEFVNLANAIRFYGINEKVNEENVVSAPKRIPYCDRNGEATIFERGECQKKVKRFITQLSEKTAPFCRDSVPNKLEEYKREPSIIYPTHIYPNEFFGLENFCVVTKKDLGIDAGYTTYRYFVGFGP